MTHRYAYDMNIGLSYISIKWATKHWNIHTDFGGFCCLFADQFDALFRLLKWKIGKYYFFLYNNFLCYLDFYITKISQKYIHE